MVLGGVAATVGQESADDEEAIASAGYLAGRVHLGPKAGKTMGFLQLGGGAASYEFDLAGETFSVDGTSAVFGGGLTVFVTPSLQFALTLNHYAVTFEEASFGGFSGNVDFEADYSTLTVGLKYVFNRSANSGS